MASKLEELYEAHAIDNAKRFIENTRTALREHVDRFAEVARVVAELRPSSILDAPCGPGVLLDIVASGPYQPRRVVGIDISETNVWIVRNLYGHEALALDVIHYYPSERFELVMCMELLEHLEDSEFYVGKILTLSKKWALFTVPVEAGEVDGTYHVRKVHPTEIVKWVEKAGGTIKRIWMFPSSLCEKPHWIGWIFALAEVKSG